MRLLSPPFVHRCMALAAVLLTAAAAAWARAPVQADTASGVTRQDVFPKAPVHYAGGVVAWGNLEYANFRGYRPLLLDLYAHEDAAAAIPRPLVIYIHGGSWSGGDARYSGAFTDFPAVLAELAARGYVVASVNYRLTGEAKFPVQVQDIKAAIKFLRRNAQAYGIDPGRVVIWGGSAGAHLAGLVATTCGVAAFEPDISGGRMSGPAAAKAAPDPTDDCVQGLVGWYGAYDLNGLGPSDPDVRQFLSCDPATCADKIVEASPLHYVSAKSPPTLLIHGLADSGGTSPDQSRQMAAALQAAGVQVSTLFIPDVSHLFIGKTPEVTRAASLQALQASFDFIDAVTRN